MTSARGAGRPLVALADRIFDGFFLRPLRQPWGWPKGPDAEEDYRPVRFEDAHGATLAGLFGLALGTPRGTVVLAHPVRPEAKGHFLRNGTARMLREGGYNVLLYDAVGFGESAPGHFLYTSSLLAAAREAERHAPGLPLGLHGACLGGQTALHALTRSGQPFRAAVVEAAPEDYFAFFRYADPLATGLRAKLRRRWIPEVLIRAWRRLHAGDADQLYPLDHLGPAPGLGGLLLVYAERDALLPPGSGERVRDACRLAFDGTTTDVALWTVPGARHLQHRAADPEAYRARIVGFFDRHLAAVAAPA